MTTKWGKANKVTAWPALSWRLREPAGGEGEVGWEWEVVYTSDISQEPFVGPAQTLDTGTGETREDAVRAALAAADRL